MALSTGGSGGLEPSSTIADAVELWLSQILTRAKTGSIARAAEQLHLTPHAISGQLREFEQTLGVALFQKVGRNLQLTDAGRRILSHADTIFTTGDDLLETLREQVTERKRHFRVGTAQAGYARGALASVRG